MVNAYRLVKKHYNVRLVLAGSGGGERESVEILAELREAAQHDGDILVLELPPDAHLQINALQRAATIVIQKSVREGFGLGAAEAMWKGKPVIAGFAGGLSQQIVYDVTGYTVHSVEGAAFRLRHLLNNPELIARMGAAGREHVRRVVPDHAPPDGLPGAAHTPHALRERWAVHGAPQAYRSRSLHRWRTVGPWRSPSVLLTYNNAETLDAVLARGRRRVARHFPTLKAALVVNATRARPTAPVSAAAAAGLPAIVTEHQAPAGERVAVPFHGVPGRGAALRTAFGITQQLGARALRNSGIRQVSATPDWILRLAGPVLDGKADFVAAAYTRHRYEGTISRLLLSPLAPRALRPASAAAAGRPAGALRAPGGTSARSIPSGRSDRGATSSDLWITGTAIADGFALGEAWLGPRIGALANADRGPADDDRADAWAPRSLVMQRHEDLWLEVRGSEAIAAIGDAALPGTEAIDVDVERHARGVQSRGP